jgi:5-hydroxyisourate hydrolase-like protein (transthyretin family)
MLNHYRVTKFDNKYSIIKKMKTKTFKTLLAIMLSSQILAFATENPSNSPSSVNSNISGTIIDSSSGSPLEYVSVAVYKASDSTLVTGTISDTEGKFKVGNINDGDYYVTPSFIGFEKKQTSKVSISDKKKKLTLEILN